MKRSAELAAAPCRLCGGDEVLFFHEDAHAGGRRYDRCSTCGLVMAERASFLDWQAQREVYDLHQNSPDDPGYRLFLERICAPMLQRLPPRSHGLDFGCGPGPTLSVMFEEAGHEVALFDPIYAPRDSVLSTEYDFVTATEVFEHFQDPRADLERIWACVKAGGLLGVMTKRVTGVEAFSSWHYRLDPTHVSFFARETLEWLADIWGATMTVLGDDAVIFERPGVAMP